MGYDKPHFYKKRRGKADVFSFGVKSSDSKGTLDKWVSPTKKKQKKTKYLYNQ